LLRREGLYSSHLNGWRKQREQGTLSGLTPRKRGPKPSLSQPLAQENQRLQRENNRLSGRLKQAEMIIEIQKKVSEILGIPLKNLEIGENV
jgi:transposase